MINQSLVKDLNSLVKRAKRSNVLEERAPAGRILGARGIGEPKVSTTSTGTTTGDLAFTETIVVYSDIVITEDGAFETPDGWPDFGAYSSSAVAPAILPDSLFFLSGVLHLDTKVQYYLQRRVHLVFYEQLDGETIIGSRQDSRLVTLETPYLGGYYSGLSMLGTDWVLSLKGQAIGLPSSMTLDKVAELEGSGVSFA